MLNNSLYFILLFGIYLVTAKRLVKRQSAFEAPHASLPPLFGLGGQQHQPQPSLFAQPQPQPLPQPSQIGSSQLSSQSTTNFGQQQPLIGAQQASNTPSSWGASYGPQAQGGSVPQGNSQGLGSSFQGSNSGSVAPQSGTYGPTGQQGPSFPQTQPQTQSVQGPPPGTPAGFDYWFAEGTAHTYCSYGVNPIPRYNTPHKRCVPNHPGCGIIFSCIIDVP